MHLICVLQVAYRCKVYATPSPAPYRDPPCLFWLRIGYRIYYWLHFGYTKRPCKHWQPNDTIPPFMGYVENL